MKLIELLVQELPKRGGWIPAVKTMAQDGNGDIWGYDCANPRSKGYFWLSNSGNDLVGNSKIQARDLASDWRAAIITREQYESALAAKKDGWIEWLGGKYPPVSTNTVVDVKLEKGYVQSGYPAGEYSWEHVWEGSNTIAYRLHRPDINSRANDDRLEQDLNECIGASEEQEWSGDWVPPIGYSCEMQDSKGAWLPVVIIAKNDGFTFGWSYDYRIVLFGDKADEFRPLRTEAERKREAAKNVIAELCRSSASNGHSADLIFDAIAYGKITGVRMED